MTKPDHPKLAPADVPVEAALYLDKAALHLTELIKVYDLELIPYDLHHPDHSAWFHGLYGESYDRELCIQVLTDEEMAPSFTALLRGWIRLYSSDGGSEWLLLETWRVRGLADLTILVADLLDVLRFACVFRMPHPTDPDPKA